MPDCHEDIICPDCKEHCTRHDPCCPGTPTCDCIHCEACGELAPEWEPGFCRECYRAKESAEQKVTAERAYREWRRS